MAALGFDTATGDTVACAVRGGDLLREARIGPSEAGSPLHTGSLLELVEEVVGAAGGWPAIDLIAVGVGPGTFTGLRVGVATARGLGLARGIEVRGAGTLDGLGSGLAERAGERPRLAVLDARRGEVYGAAYAASGEVLWGPLVLPPEVLAERAAALPGTALCGGSGALRFRHELASGGVEIPDDADPVHRVAARHICALAAAAPGEDGPAPAAPIYLRPPDAERWRERDPLKQAK